MAQSFHCPLCNASNGKQMAEHYFMCSNCYGIAKNRDNILTHQEEKARYDTHENDVTDKGYQEFVSPITEYILENYLPKQVGLDFGCGPGPVISYLLRQRSYQITGYDPFYENNTEKLEKTYDYIACCEVIEHFVHPAKEFGLLYSLLNNNGELICKTHLYDDTITFEQWYYKLDPTHVFFYQKETIEWIANNYQFSLSWIDGRTFALKK